MRTLGKIAATLGVIGTIVASSAVPATAWYGYHHRHYGYYHHRHYYAYHPYYHHRHYWHHWYSLTVVREPKPETNVLCCCWSSLGPVVCVGALFICAKLPRCNKSRVAKEQFSSGLSVYFLGKFPHLNKFRISVLGTECDLDCCWRTPQRR